MQLAELEETGHETGAGPPQRRGVHEQEVGGSRAVVVVDRIVGIVVRIEVELSVDHWELSPRLLADRLVVLRWPVMPLGMPHDLCTVGQDLGLSMQCSGERSALKLHFI